MNKKGKYSPEFKEQAVKRTLSGSLTIRFCPKTGPEPCSLIFLIKQN
nr:transposase [Leptospira noguchii]